MNPIRRVRNWFKRNPVIPVVRLSGVIGGGTPFRQGLSLANVAVVLDRAFDMAGEAVAIEVNSPGGSPVQSRLIFQRIRDLAKENNVRVYMFAEDVAASGGYMLLCAGDEIYADTSSIVGSIGVIAAGFGFVELINKIGVERRVYTAGEQKLTLDAFKPEDPEDVARLKAIQAEVHEDFIALVRDRRGKAIEDAGDQLFTGAFWAGRKAVELGLIDGISDIRSKMREVYGEDVGLKLIAAERGLLRRRVPGVSATLSSLEPKSLAEDLISALEAKAIWARYGL
ncbi:MAG TPA: S49 family peptidase [Hyphomicrobiales bacterium]|nr:S49 family peptidase [Hyphomicrobiales bacterium]